MDNLHEICGAHAWKYRRLGDITLIAVMNVTKYIDSTYFFTLPPHRILMVNTVLFCLFTALHSFGNFSY